MTDHREHIEAAIRTQRQSLAARLTFETVVFRAVHAGVTVDELGAALDLPPDAVQGIVDQFGQQGRADLHVIE